MSVSDFFFFKENNYAHFDKQWLQIAFSYWNDFAYLGQTWQEKMTLVYSIFPSFLLQSPLGFGSSVTFVIMLSNLVLNFFCIQLADDTDNTNYKQLECRLFGGHFSFTFFQHIGNKVYQCNSSSA